MESSFTNLNYDLVLEMAEGDKEFETQLLEAMIISVQDLREKYTKGLETGDEELISQARHKIKPSLELFGLEKLDAILSQGKQQIDGSSINDPAIEAHREKFLAAVDDLLEELSSIPK